MSNPSQVEISVVVPVYRSAETLKILVARLRSVLTELTGPDGFQIVLVEDCGPDHSWAILQSIYHENATGLTLIRLMRNFGQHNAILCGFHHARGRYVITIDDDLQNPPEEIPKLFDAIKANQWDMAYGDIRGDKKHHAFRNLGSRFVYGFLALTFQTNVPMSSFRIIRHEIVREIIKYDRSFTFVDGLIFWCTKNAGSVVVRHESRASGRSGYSLRKLLALALNVLTNFSIIPLQVVSLAGFIFALTGFGLGTYYMIMWLLGLITVSGFASLIVSILVMGGVQLLSLGMIGEYLGRIHLNLNRKPQFIERDRLESFVDDSQ